MGRPFWRPPGTAHSKKVTPPASSVLHSKKGSVPGANIRKRCLFHLIKTRQGTSLSVDRTRRGTVSRPAISCDAS